MGRWLIIPAAAIVQTVSLLFYSVAPSLTWLYPIRILDALSVAAFLPTALTIIQDLTPPGKRGDTIGKFLTSIGIASMIGPFLCTFLVTYIDYAALFRVAAIFPVLGCIPLQLAKPKNPHENSPKEREATPLASIIAVISSKNLLILAYLRFSWGFTFAFFMTLFAIYAESNLFIFTSLIAMLFGVRGVANMLSRIPSGKLVDKIGYKGPLVLAFIMLTTAYFIVSETANISLLILAMVLHGLSHGMRIVTAWTAVGDLVPSEIVNTATAYLSTIFDISSAFGALTAGILTLFFETPTIFKLASIVALTGALVATLVRRSPIPRL